MPSFDPLLSELQPESSSPVVVGGAGSSAGVTDNGPRTLAERVFAQVQDAIVKGEIAPGSKLGEVELAERYGVSRGPLREALRRLEERGLLIKVPHVGTRVASLSLAELLEIYQVREALEGMAGRLAARNMSDDEISALRSLLHQHEQQSELQEGRAYFQQEGDLDFHYRIIHGSKNATLIRLLCGDLYYLARMYRYQFSAAEGRPQKAFDEHRMIVDALEARDAEMVELLMRRHIAGAKRNVEEHFKQIAMNT